MRKLAYLILPVYLLQYTPSTAVRADTAKLAQARKRASRGLWSGSMLAQIEGELNAPDHRAVEGWWRVRRRRVLQGLALGLLLLFFLWMMI